MPLGAHQYEIQPVKIEMRIEPTQIRVHFDSLADYWLDPVLHVPLLDPLPASNWGEDYESRAKDYINKSFELKLDDRALTLTRLTCFFRQEPLQVQSARVNFDAIYPIPIPGERLSGRAQFFAEYKTKLAKEDIHEEHEHKEFVSILSIIGKENMVLTLPLEKPDFEISVQDHMLTKSQKIQESFSKIAFRVISSPFFWIAIIALAYKITQRLKRRRNE